MTQTNGSTSRGRMIAGTLLGLAVLTAASAAPVAAHHAPSATAGASVDGSATALTAWRDGWGVKVRVTVKDTAADGDCAYAVVTVAVDTAPDPDVRFENCQGSGNTLVWEHRIAAGSTGTGIPAVKLMACRNRNNLPDPCREVTVTLPQMTAHGSAERIRLMENIQSVSLPRFFQLRQQGVAPYDWSDDGCSLPAGLMPVWSERFAAACVRHDWGYRNYGKGTFQPTDARRKQVDDVFYRDMIAICDYRGYANCVDAALAFYAGVRNFGSVHFYGY